MTRPANDAASPRPVAEPSQPCPICGKPATSASRPFCSKRCADVDLHRWLEGTYRIPAAEDGRDVPPDGDDG